MANCPTDAMRWCEPWKHPRLRTGGEDLLTASAVDIDPLIVGDLGRRLDKPKARRVEQRLHGRPEAIPVSRPSSVPQDARLGWVRNARASHGGCLLVRQGPIGHDPRELRRSANVLRICPAVGERRSHNESGDMLPDSRRSDVLASLDDVAGPVAPGHATYIGPTTVCDCRGESRQSVSA